LSKISVGMGLKACEIPKFEVKKKEFSPGKASTPSQIWFFYIYHDA